MRTDEAGGGVVSRVILAIARSKVASCSLSQRLWLLEGCNLTRIGSPKNATAWKFSLVVHLFRGYPMARNSTFRSFGSYFKSASLQVCVDK